MGEAVLVCPFLFFFWGGGGGGGEGVETLIFACPGNYRVPAA